jgi:electron transfer flavoprotein beta subunit
MKILVPIKKVIDYTVKIRVKADETGVETQGVKMSINPFDEIAIEEAVRLKEQSIAQEVVVVTIGLESHCDILRQALALGADRALLVIAESADKLNTLDSLDIAHILKLIALKESPDLIIMGKQAIDDDCNQTGQMLSALLGWPQATFASQVKIESGVAFVTREVDGGIERMAFQMPGVITTDLRLNQPRYASLPNLMKAKQKPIDNIKINDLNYTPRGRMVIQSVVTPPKRQGGQTLSSVAELAQRIFEAARSSS